MFERGEVIKMAFLALVGGESIFLLGPPGTGKSMVSRQIKYAISDANSFEYLMNRFSTPEEIFGPISLKALDEDRYERKIEGYLPTSTIVFLDEIWKASPAIQNTLLTIINEKIFRNGTKDHNAPMKLLISASNELPAHNEGLEALFDRFLIRMWVGNLTGIDNFKSLLTSERSSKLNITENEQIKIEEIEQAQSLIEGIVVDSKVIEFIQELKKTLTVELGEKAPYISDRRWKKIIWLLKTSAWASERSYIDFPDLLLIQNMIWENEEQIDLIRPVLKKCLLNFITGKFGYSTISITKAIDKIEAELIKAEKYQEQFIITNERDGDGNTRPYCLFDAQALRDKKANFVKLPISISKDGKLSLVEELKGKYPYWYVSTTRNGTFKSGVFQYSSLSNAGDKLIYTYIYELIPLKEKVKVIDQKKIANIKNDLFQLSNTLAEIENEKAQMQNHLNSQNGIFTSNYSYECRTLINELSSIIKETSTKINELTNRLEANV